MAAARGVLLRHYGFVTLNDLADVGPALQKPLLCIRILGDEVVPEGAALHFVDADLLSRRARAVTKELAAYLGNGPAGGASVNLVAIHFENWRIILIDAIACLRRIVSDDYENTGAATFVLFVRMVIQRPRRNGGACNLTNVAQKVRVLGRG